MKKFNLTWTPPANNGGAEITGHDVGYTPSGGSETVVATGSTAAAYTLTGLTDGTEYSVRVRAENSAGKGAWTNAVTQAAALAPSQVTGLAVDSTGDGTIDLSWTAPASDAAITDYSVEYTPSGGSATTVLVGSAATSYQLTGLNNDTEYTVRVAAISAVGIGSYSATATGTPQTLLLTTDAANFIGEGSVSDKLRPDTTNRTVNGSVSFTANASGTLRLTWSRLSSNDEERLYLDGAEIAQDGVYNDTNGSTSKAVASGQTVVLAVELNRSMTFTDLRLWVE